MDVRDVGDTSDDPGSGLITESSFHVVVPIPFGVDGIHFIEVAIETDLLLFIFDQCRGVLSRRGRYVLLTGCFVMTGIVACLRFISYGYSQIIAKWHQ